MKKFKKKDFVKAWWFLFQHPYYAIPYKTENGYTFKEGFEQSLDIEPRKINPKTNAIDDNKSLNTKNIVWLESGHYYIVEKEESITDRHCINPSLNVQGNTFEDAIIKLANKVLKKYGDLDTWTYFDNEKTNFKKWKKLIK